ncbi:hypothetical protein KJE20_00052 [Pyrenophora tritici-repentis]|uniref:Uncharacterized protein n=1 Tax=Pyrenophora tritici-repentis TaxID=45151 RepID=A0A922T3R7_9PLEO|nr:hypothetical protein Ptr86124_000026 [Pyrenophora tritici-repentis]KAI1686875.1 hypothetical protein KJE20_00052 [Pyrenophora tritici-repentis]
MSTPKTSSEKCPYATPPAPATRKGTRQASSYRPSCAGRHETQVSGFSQPGNESSGASASDSDARYNSSFLVSKSVHMDTPAVVFVAYKLPLGFPFGFLAGAAVERAGLTNNGLRD